MAQLVRRWQAELGDSQPLSVETPLPFHIDLFGHEREPDEWQPDWIVKKYFSSAGKATGD